MCGIAGLVSPRCADPALVVAAAKLLRHRGPDDEGFVAIGVDEGAALPFAGDDTAPQSLGDALPYLASTHAPGDGPWDVVLASRRLSILDLSFRGHQPLCSPDRQAWIVHNGEIYNYRELAGELAARGHRFAGESDTEVALAAYREWGTGCFERFNGMWGMAIWDVRARRLVLSRDRFGVKPLYYAFSGDALAFGSEIRAVIATRVAGTSANEPAVADFIATGRIDIRGAETCYADVLQVEPGALVTYELGGAPVQQDYYNLERRLESTRPGELLELLDDSVALRLRSDVPVGSSLSGGLDSSSVVALAQRRLGGASPIRTFTFGSGADDDERAFAHAVNAHVGATGSDVDVPSAPLPELLFDIVREQEEPIGSGSIVAQRQVMQAAHEAGLKVLLDGQGGDEALAGYGYYHGASLADALARGHVLRWLRGLRATDGDRRWLVRASGGELRHATPFAGSRLRAKQLEDVRLHLPALLHYEDRNSMIFSIETRLPFLDYRVVELGLALPDEEKIDRGWTKLALRRAVADALPSEIVWRRDKVQFSAPQEAWLRGPLRELTCDLLSRPRAGAQAKSLADRLSQGDTAEHGDIWRRLVVEVWRDQAAAAPPASAA